jgi:glycine cleavage system H lipoate-binding protein
VSQEELGDLVYVELPEVGSSVEAGERFSVVESVKVRRGGGCSKALLPF